MRGLGRFWKQHLTIIIIVIGYIFAIIASIYSIVDPQPFWKQ